VERTVFETPGFRWFDLVEPDRADLERVGLRNGLPASAVQDCLDPEHLPKWERFEGASFVILRAHDEHAEPQADSPQALTRKVAIFWGPGFLLTIHRKDQPYLSAVMDRWRGRPAGEADPSALSASLLVDLMNAVVASYEAPLEEAEARADGFEAELLREHDVSATLREMYHIKRRVNLIKRLLWRTLGIITRLPTLGLRSGPAIQDLREAGESMHFYADELLEDVTNLLSMQLALAAHRTNEVVQVLTVFSAFFLPLTFIVGVYGMNFAHMPELAHPWGYPGVWLIMAAVSAAIWFWFRRRRWLA
jgi:magnesium transporter